MIPAPATREEIGVLARRAGLNLPSAYFDELVDAYAHVERMLARLHRGRAYAAEPAHVFVASTFGAEKD